SSFAPRRRTSEPASEGGVALHASQGCQTPGAEFGGGLEPSVGGTACEPGLYHFGQIWRRGKFPHVAEHQARRRERTAVGREQGGRKCARAEGGTPTHHSRITGLEASTHLANNTVQA